MRQGSETRWAMQRKPLDVILSLTMTNAALSVCTAGPLTLAWGNWFTLLGFLVLIKPIRERTTFFMLQFNSLDRPEDRPNTLSWIVGGNIIPGCLMIIFFRWYDELTHRCIVRALARCHRSIHLVSNSSSLVFFALPLGCVCVRAGCTV